MESRINSPLTIGQNGHTVTVTGPITSWSSDETSATFAVMITQVQANGHIVVAVGRSDQVNKPATEWTATARVEGNGGLTAGTPAAGFAIASVEETGGYGPYPWETVDIQLVAAETVVGAHGGGR